MQKIKWITVLVLCLAAASLLAQAAPQVVDTKNDASVDAQRERQALQSLLKVVEREIIWTADAMPADKFGLAPTDGEFKGVRTSGQMVKHFSATRHISAAAARSHPLVRATNWGPKLSEPRLKFLGI